MNKNVKLVIGAAVGFLMGYLALDLILPNSMQNALEQAEKEINQKCPYMVDEYTQLDSVTVPKGSRTLQYHYTLDSQATKSELEEAVKDFKNVIIQNIKESPNLANLKKMGVRFEYFYFNKNREKVMEIAVQPSEYKE